MKNLSAVPMGLRSGLPAPNSIRGGENRGFVITRTGAIVVLGSREARRSIERERRKQMKTAKRAGLAAHK